MRIGENPPIWVSHSPTIKDCKKLIFLSFKDIKLMYYVAHNNAYLLLQTNNNTSKIVGGELVVKIGEKIGRFLKRKIGPTDFHVTPTNLKKKNQADPVVAGNRWEKSFDGN